MQSPLVTAGTVHSKNTEIMDQVNKPMDDEETENESEEQELLWQRRNKIAGLLARVYSTMALSLQTRRPRAMTYRRILEIQQERSLYMGEPSLTLNR